MKENKNKQTSGNAQMCRCTNRLDSSAVVVPGCLRGRSKHNNKGHQLHAVEHQCTGGTILEWNILQSCSEEVWRHHFSVQLICEGIQRRLPPGGAQDCFEHLTLTSSLRRVLGGDPVRGFVWFVARSQDRKCRLFKKFSFLGSRKQGQRCISHLRPSALQRAAFDGCTVWLIALKEVRNLSPSFLVDASHVCATPQRSDLGVTDALLFWRQMM